MRKSPLIDRQGPFIKLHDRGVDGGGINRPDAPAAGAGPAAVGVLRPLQMIEHLRSILAPRKPLGFRRRAVEFLPAVVAEDVHALAEVVMGVFVVADARAADVLADADSAVAILEPLLAQ